MWSSGVVRLACIEATAAAEAGRDLDSLTVLLGRFSPAVELCSGEPGIFWLDAEGLTFLFPSLKAWCGRIRGALAAEGVEARAAVGFSRFGTYAAAKSVAAEVLFPDPQQERSFALQAGIEVLPLSREVRERFVMLGITTVGSFLALPAGGIRKRFGPEVEKCYRFADGALELPVQSTAIYREPGLFRRLPAAERSTVRILPFLRRALETLGAAVRKRGRLIRELRVSLLLEEDEVPLEPVLPASPSVDGELLLELLALRLERLPLPGAVEAFRMTVRTVEERNIQNELFRIPSADSLREADRVFARLRGVFGNDCVVRACLQEEHLPERSFRWERLVHLLPPENRGPKGAGGGGRVRRLVRRVLDRPTPFGEFDEKKFRRLWGPYPLSNRWWTDEQSREYFYAETPGGEILWLYFDRIRGSWFRAGSVE